jgi:hypothetical protein
MFFSPSLTSQWKLFAMAQLLMAPFNAGTTSEIREKMAMKRRLLCFLVGLLIICVLLIATFALDNASSAPLDRPVEQAGPSRERPASAPGASSTTGKDSKRPQMECIYLHRSTGLGVGGMVIMIFTPYLVLKDGTIYRNLRESPEDLDIEKSRREEPNMWGRWQKRGKNLILEWNDGSRETDDYYQDIVIPARKTDRLDGFFLSISGGGNTALGGAFSVAMSNQFTFFEDGRFTHKKVVGGGDRSVAVSSNRNSSGTYAIDGYTLELRYADGRTLRRVFYFYPSLQKRHDVIGIGGNAYVLRD